MSRILFLTTALPGNKANGGEIATTCFIEALRRAGHEVAVTGYVRPASSYSTNSHETIIEERPIETERAKFFPAIWFLTALRKNLAYSAAKYWSEKYIRTLRKSFDETHVDLVIIDHAQIGFLYPYVPCKHVIFIAHNVESQIYAGQASKSSGLKKWLYAREAHLIKNVEHNVARACSMVWALTKNDSEYFGRIGARSRTFAIPSAFSTETPVSVASHAAGGDIAILGTWTWKANAEGLHWFFDEVYPLLPAKLKIEVGGKGADWLAEKWPNVAYRGFVPDAHAFLARVRVIAIPSVSGGGVQIKTLDAIATGIPIVATPTAMRGIEQPPATVRLSAQPKQFAEHLISFCDTRPRQEDSAQALQWAASRRSKFEQDVAESIAFALAHPGPT